MTEYILRENVLSDNTLKLSDEGKVFKGGYVAIVQEWEFANAWSDRPKPPKKFRSHERLHKYLKKTHPDFPLEELI